uniref:RING-type domain-containing protein n=1 Tax=Aegilops tauschii subsp. strangulata TaxID=200361 RepID=A0A453PUG6_AEGTS
MSQHTHFRAPRRTTRLSPLLQVYQNGEGMLHEMQFWLTQGTLLSFCMNSPLINALFDHFKMALDCFFAVWFVVGNVWIFGGRSSAVDAPNLYRLCIVFLTFSCIGYAMPFILCAMICCCLPCIISVMGFREDTNNTRGATSESINTLPTYKFKTKKRRHGSGNEAEGQVCCICLAKYAHNEELRELPCTHCFHKECVDKWLKINALCPLCKAEIASSSGTSDTRHIDHTVPTQEIEMH